MEKKVNLLQKNWLLLGVIIIAFSIIFVMINIQNVPSGGGGGAIYDSLNKESVRVAY